MQNPNWIPFYLFVICQHYNSSPGSWWLHFLLFYLLSTKQRMCVYSLSMLDISQLFENLRYYNIILRDSSQFFFLFFLCVPSSPTPFLHMPPEICIFRDLNIQEHSSFRYVFSLFFTDIIHNFIPRIQFLKDLSALMHHLHVYHVRHDLRWRGNFKVSSSSSLFSQMHGWWRWWRSISFQKKNEKLVEIELYNPLKISLVD